MRETREARTRGLALRDLAEPDDQRVASGPCPVDGELPPARLGDRAFSSSSSTADVVGREAVQCLIRPLGVVPVAHNFDVAFEAFRGTEDAPGPGVRLLQRAPAAFQLRDASMLSDRTAGCGCSFKLS